MAMIGSASPQAAKEQTLPKERRLSDKRKDGFDVLDIVK